MATDIGNDWTLEGMDNPLTIQDTLLKRFESQTGYAIVDNNNPASVLMEGFATLAGMQMKMMDDTVRPAIYPARAVTTADLLKHISDYDYVDIFSAPASTTIVIVVEKNYIMTHSLPVPDPNNPGKNKDYLKMTIPRSTQIHMGDHTFGLYYPIEIRSSIKSGRFSVVYATTDVNGNIVNNPLKPLETNVLDFEFREFNGHKLAYIRVPVYQFLITGHDEVLMAAAGYKRRIPYTNRFYALRVWADVLTNFGHDDTVSDNFERRELELAVSGQVYDPTVPTAVFTPDENEKEVTIEIPYIYFTEGRIRGPMHVDIYTTEGELNYQVPFNTDESCVIDMFSNISTDEDEVYNSTHFAEPFRAMPAVRAFPTKSIIAGGSNGLDFEQIRQRVIKGVNTTVLQTPDDIDAYFAAYGYTATLYRDGITDRIFIIHTVVRDEDNVVASMDTIGSLFDFKRINEYSTVVPADDGGSTFTILPSTLYRYDVDKRICIPLTDVERNALDAMTPAEMVNEYNRKVFTLSPFHLVVNTASRYPTTITYDMLQVKRVARTFIAARDDQYGLALNTVNLDVLRRPGDVADRYRLSLRVARMGFGDKIPVIERSEHGQAEKKIRVLLGFVNDDGEFRWAEANWVSTERGDSENASNEIFELEIAPSYVFHQANNEHTVQMAFWNNGIKSDFFLKTECRILLMMKNNIVLNKEATDEEEASVIRFEGEPHLKNINPDATNFTFGSVVLPTSKTVAMMSEVGFADYVCVTEQKSVFQFGSPVDELDQRINLTYSEAVYQTHKTTKFRVAEDDIYKKDAKNNLVITEHCVKLERDDHPVFEQGKMYYTDESGTNLYDGTITIGEQIYTSDSIPDIYVKVFGAEKLFEAGTVKCMTVGVEDSVVPNRYTKSNYMNRGCVKPVENDDPIPVEDIIDDAITSGTELPLDNVPLVPRFTFLTKNKDVAIPTGKFELSNALTMKPISSQENIWALVGKGSVDSVTGKVTSTVIETVNALKFTISHLAADVEAIGNSTSPLDEENIIRTNADGSKTSLFKVGTFLLLSNDESSPDYVHLGTLGEAIPSGSSCSRLYYKFRDRISDDDKESLCWFCIAQGQNKSKMLEFLADEEIDGPGYNPKYYGFAYVLHQKTGNPADPIEDDVEVPGSAQYVSFLTTITRTAALEKFTEFVPSEDEGDTIIGSSQIFYVENEAGGYRVVEDEDLQDDGEFIYGKSYFTKDAVEITYELPDFSRFEKKAWDNHEVKEEVPESKTVAEANVKYCYLDKESMSVGITKWIDMVGIEVGTTFLDYFGGGTLLEHTADGKIYFKKDELTCIDPDYGWEQMGNRWPWEVKNWKLIGYYDDVPYLKSDDALVISSDYDRMHRYWEYASDQTILDEKGKPLEDYDKERSIQYLIDMLQMDAKLAKVTVAKEDTLLGSNFGDDGEWAHKYPTTVVNVLRNHFDNVGRARDTMFTNSRLFFEPVKSLGFANFNIGNNAIRELPLDITMKFRLHVSFDAYEDDILLENMRAEIVKIIDAAMDAGYVNCAEIAQKIINDTVGVVKYVDILGINGDQDLQTMKPVDKNVRVHLKHTLRLLDDGMTIDSDRGLEIEAVVNE